MSLSLAFRDAGYIPVTNRLTQIARDVLAMPVEDWLACTRLSWDEPTEETRLMSVAMTAVAANPRNWDGAKDALYEAVKDDPALLWALFEPYRLAAVHKLLTEAAGQLRSQEQKQVGAKIREAEKQTIGQTQTVNPSTDACRPAGMDAVLSVARLSMLEMFKVNGQSIGDVTPREANAWASSRERDARYVRLLTANLPDNEPIRKHRNADEADQLYVQASVDD